MKFSKISTPIFILLFSLIISGCAVGHYEYLMRSKTDALNSKIVTRYEVKDYKILGPVRAQGRSVEVLAVYVEGKEGEALLWDAAREEYGSKVTGIKDIQVTYEYKAILPPIYSEVITTYTGIAVSER